MSEHREKFILAAADLHKLFGPMPQLVAQPLSFRDILGENDNAAHFGAFLEPGPNFPSQPDRFSTGTVEAVFLRPLDLAGQPPLMRLFPTPRNPPYVHPNKSNNSNKSESPASGHRIKRFKYASPTSDIIGQASKSNDGRRTTEDVPSYIRQILF